MPDFTIYIVDDDAAVRDSWRVLLEIEFPRVREFESCQDFLAAFEPTRSGCLVLDIHMPDMNGFDLMERLKQEGSAIPVILVTGRTDASIRARATDLGAVALLEKPIEYGELLAAIERARESNG